jgi:hypothetical protein
MHVPTFLVMPCFLAAFVLFCRQYYVGNPSNRLTDRRFLLAGASLALAFIYVPVSLTYPAMTGVSVLFFAAGAVLLYASLRMNRRRRRTSG